MILDVLEQTGALLQNDHFVGTSGMHFDTYINKDALYPHIDAVMAVTKEMAEQVAHLPIDIVAGPALGGIILSQWVAYHLRELTRRDILSIYAEKKDGSLTLTRGYDALVQGKNVLVVEDLISTGGSVMSVIETVKKNKGTVVGAAVMVNKNKDVTSETFGIPLFSLETLDISLYTADTCLLCAKGVPINTTIGHGPKFVQEKNAL